MENRMSKIAFIGLGTMGLPMASHLVKAGHNVVGYDPQAAATEAFVGAGGSSALRIADAVADVDAVISMVPTAKHVRSVYLGDDGVMAHCRQDALLMDSSTIDTDTARELNAIAVERGLAMLDAPVSGAMAAAHAATLIFMCGGEADAFERAKPIHAGMGRESIHVGVAGNGQAAKICNNVLTGIHIAAACESLALGQRLGLDLNVLHDIIGKGSGGSWVMERYCPKGGILENAPSSNDYKPGFTNALMAKDVGLFQQTAQTEGLPTPLASAARSMYQLAINNGLGDRDCSIIFEMIGGKND